MASSRTFMLASAFFAVAILAGCSSKMDKAIQQAKQQAASSGQAQQVVAVDSNGTTTTAIVQPPAQGQKQETVTTTTTPPPAGQPKPAAHDPVVSAVSQNAAQNAGDNAPMGMYGLGGQPAAQPGQPAQAAAPGQSAPPSSAQAGTKPGAAAPAPVSITIPAGTRLAVRIDQTINVKSARAGDGFTGEVARPIMGPNGGTIIPKLARVRGVVDAAHRRGRFKGRSILELRLTSLELNGQQYPIRTADMVRSKKGKGRRTAAFIGGGSGLGMLIGGVASGGVGLLAGGLAGAGAGTVGAAFTGNRDIVIPAETIVSFRLAHNLVLSQ